MVPLLFVSGSRSLFCRSVATLFFFGLGFRLGASRSRALHSPPFSGGRRAVEAGSLGRLLLPVSPPRHVVVAHLVAGCRVRTPVHLVVPPPRARARGSRLDSAGMRRSHLVTTLCWWTATGKEEEVVPLSSLLAL